MYPHVWVVGSANYDLVFRTEHFPVAGETILGGEFSSFPGGKGANQAVAIGKLGGKVSFVGCVGDDPFGKELSRSLQDSGVDLTHLTVDPTTPSGCASVMLDGHGQNQIIVAPGSNMKLAPEKVRSALSEVDDQIVLAQLEIPLDSVLAASEAKRFILNPAPACPLPEELYSRCFAITPNEHELEQLVGLAPHDIQSCREASGKLLNKGVENVVITMGSRGCYWTNGREDIHIPAFEVRAVDTVAAGDAFNGALALFFAGTQDWRHSLRLANAVAALSVTRNGAQSSLPSLAELENFVGTL